MNYIFGKFEFKEVTELILTAEKPIQINHMFTGGAKHLIEWFK
jgi:hypothetical protein